MMTQNVIFRKNGVRNRIFTAIQKSLAAFTAAYLKATTTIGMNFIEENIEQGRNQDRTERKTATNSFQMQGIPFLSPTHTILLVINYPFTLLKIQFLFLGQVLIRKSLQLPLSEYIKIKEGLSPSNGQLM